jgi:hypothetical protein
MKHLLNEGYFEVGTYDRNSLFVGNKFLLVALKQNVFRLEVRVRDVNGVEELYGLEGLPGDLTDLVNMKSLVVVILNEVVQTFTQRLEYQAHVNMMAPRFRIVGAVHEPLLQVDDAALAASVLLEVHQDLGLGLCAFGVAGHSSDDFYRVYAVFIYFKTLECPAECAIAKMSEDFVLLSAPLL